MWALCPEVNMNYMSRHSPSYTQVGVTSTVVSCIWPSQVVCGSKRPYILMESHFRWSWTTFCAPGFYITREESVGRRLWSLVVCDAAQGHTTSLTWKRSPRFHHWSQRSWRLRQKSPERVRDSVCRLGESRLCASLQWRVYQCRLHAYRHVPSTYRGRKQVAFENTDHIN